MDGSSSVGLYQLLFQHWKKRPGVLAPRTVIVTDLQVFLCTEDHCEFTPSQLSSSSSAIVGKSSAATATGGRGGGNSAFAEAAASSATPSSAATAAAAAGKRRSRSMSGGSNRVRPRLRIVDCASLGDIKEVRPEDSPEAVTILVKRPLKAKRWRLLLGTRRNAERLVEEVRRRME